MPSWKIWQMAELNHANVSQHDHVVVILFQPEQLEIVSFNKLGANSQYISQIFVIDLKTKNQSVLQ